MQFEPPCSECTRSAVYNTAWHNNSKLTWPVISSQQEAGEVTGNLQPRKDGRMTREPTTFTTRNLLKLYMKISSMPLNKINKK